MNAILRQIKANFRGHKLQSALILLTLFASATLLTVALNTLNVAQRSFDNLFNRTHAPHLWLLLDPRALPTEELERVLTELPGVEQSSRAYRTISTTLFLGELRESGPALRDWPDPSDPIGRPLLIEGRPPYSGETDAIVLDRNAAVANDVHVGELIGILTPSGRINLEVVGLFVSTEVCPSCFPFITYVAPGTMHELGLLSPDDNETGSMEVGLRLTDPSKTQETLEAAIAALPDDAVWGWDKWQDLRTYADSSIQLQRILLLTFTIVALLATGLLIANAIRGSVRAQTRQMGLLKAVGFTEPQLIWVYLLEYASLALAASVAGFVVGSVVASLTLRSITLLFGDTMARPETWIALATPFVTLFVTAFFVFFAVRRAVHMNVVHAIRMGEERPHHREWRLSGAILRRLPTPLAIGLQDILVQPGRAGLMAIGLGIAVMTLVSALTIHTTLQTILSDPAQLGFDGDLSLRLSEFISEEEVLRLISTQPEIASFYGERWGSFHFPGESTYYYARFREGDLDDFRFPIIEGRLFEKHGEVIAGYGLVSEKGLKIGDSMDIVISDHLFTVNVAGFYRESSNNGNMLILPSETLRHVNPDLKTYTFIVKLHPGADPQSVAEELTEISNNFLGVLVIGIDELPVNVASLPKIMVVLTLILGGIAALGVFNSIWMTVQERRRGFGMLKAVGMTPEQVIIAVLSGVVGIALVAYFIGLPLGLTGIRALMNMVANSIGFGPLRLWTNEVGLILLLPGIVLLALLGAFIPAYRAGRTSVMDVLRYE
ncbi:MAG: FtsX-like permease family protein [Anaerolineales bacterium]|nr:FtsX-like permease family protein [Anaerolineales bacterium]